MALSTYSDLQTAVANHLHRSDLAGIIPDLITLAEHRIYGDLNSRKQDSVTEFSTVADQEYITLPDDFMNFRALVIPTTKAVLDYKAPDQFAIKFVSIESGSPNAYTIVGDKLYLSPVPDAVYTLRGVYQAKVPALSAGTNWLITSFPAVYLYATLVASSPYLKDDNRIPVWEKLYQDAIVAVNNNDWSNMSTITVRGDVTI